MPTTDETRRHELRELERQLSSARTASAIMGARLEERDRVAARRGYTARLAKRRQCDRNTVAATRLGERATHEEPSASTLLNKFADEFQRDSELRVVRALAARDQAYEAANEAAAANNAAEARAARSIEAAIKVSTDIGAAVRDAVGVSETRVKLAADAARLSFAHAVVRDARFDAKRLAERLGYGTGYNEDDDGGNLLELPSIQLGDDSDAGQLPLSTNGDRTLTTLALIEKCSPELAIKLALDLAGRRVGRMAAPDIPQVSQLRRLWARLVVVQRISRVWLALARRFTTWATIARMRPSSWETVQVGSLAAQAAKSLRRTASMDVQHVDIVEPTTQLTVQTQTSQPCLHVESRLSVLDEKQKQLLQLLVLRVSNSEKSRAAFYRWRLFPDKNELRCPRSTMNIFQQRSCSLVLAHLIRALISPRPRTNLRLAFSYWRLLAAVCKETERLQTVLEAESLERLVFSRRFALLTMNQILLRGWRCKARVMQRWREAVAGERQRLAHLQDLELTYAAAKILAGLQQTSSILVYRVLKSLMRAFSLWLQFTKSTRESEIRLHGALQRATRRSLRSALHCLKTNTRWKAAVENLPSAKLRTQISTLERVRTCWFAWSLIIARMQMTSVTVKAAAPLLVRMRSRFDSKSTRGALLWWHAVLRDSNRRRFAINTLCSMFLKRRLEWGFDGIWRHSRCSAFKQILVNLRLKITWRSWVDCIEPAHSLRFCARDDARQCLTMYSLVVLGRYRKIWLKSTMFVRLRSINYKWKRARFALRLVTMTMGRAIMLRSWCAWRSYRQPSTMQLRAAHAMYGQLWIHFVCRSKRNAFQIWFGITVKSRFLASLTTVKSLALSDYCFQQGAIFAERIIKRQLGQAVARCWFRWQISQFKCHMRQNLGAQVRRLVARRICHANRYFLYVGFDTFRRHARLCTIRRRTAQQVAQVVRFLQRRSLARAWISLKDKSPPVGRIQLLLLRHVLRQLWRRLMSTAIGTWKLCARLWRRGQLLRRVLIRCKCRKAKCVWAHLCSWYYESRHNNNGRALDRLGGTTPLLACEEKDVILRMLANGSPVSRAHSSVAANDRDEVDAISSNQATKLAYVTPQACQKKRMFFSEGPCVMSRKSVGTMPKSIAKTSKNSARLRASEIACSAYDTGYASFLTPRRVRFRESELIDKHLAPRNAAPHSEVGRLTRVATDLKKGENDDAVDFLRAQNDMLRLQLARQQETINQQKKRAIHQGRTICEAANVIVAWPRTSP